MNARKWIYFFLFCILNPLINLLPLYWIDIFYDNLSYIGNTLGHPVYLILWACLSAFGFYDLSLRCWQKTLFPYSKNLHRILCAGMVLSCMIPYAPQSAFWIQDLHVWIAILSVGAFVLEWLYYFGWKKDLVLWEKLLLASFVFSFLCLCIPGHITASTEISFSTLVNLILVNVAFSERHATIKP